MTVGDSTDILSRVKRLIPNRWFSYTAPNRDAVMGAVSDLASWCYGLVGYAKAQSRLSTAFGVWLDIWAKDFLNDQLTRGGSQDDTFRALIKATILQERVTRAGMIAAVTTITGNTPVVFEPWNTNDTGAYSGNGQTYGSFGYGVGRGGYGSMNLPGQVFMQVYRGTPSGVPLAAGYGSPAGGYGVGAIEYVGSITQLIGITDDLIYQVIDMTKPVGTIMWVAFTPAPQILIDDLGETLTDGSGIPLSTI